jgi:hypothetical protein
MPSMSFPSSYVGTAKKVALEFPPTGPVLFSSSGSQVENSFDVDTGQYRRTNCVARASISGIDLSSTDLSYFLAISIGSKNSADGRSLRVNNHPGGGIIWIPPVSATEYSDDELTGDAAIIPIDDLDLGVNIIPLSGIPTIYQGPITVLMGVSGESAPTGLNSLSIQSVSIIVMYSNSPIPRSLNIDGDATMGQFIERTAEHKFRWSTGQPSTAYKLFYRLIGAGSWSDTGKITTPDQLHTFASSFFALGNYEWKVVSYDSEDTASADSETKTYTVGTLPDTPTIVAPIGQIDSAVPDLEFMAVAHTQERHRILEGSTVIYDSGILTQSTGLHTPSAVLEDGHAYVYKARIYVSGVPSAEASEEFNVVLVPPTQPLITLTPYHDKFYVNVNYETFDGVDYVQLMKSADYDSVTNLGTWAIIRDRLDPSTVEDVDPNYQDYEIRHGEETWYKARVWSGMAFADSEPANIVFEQGPWVLIHDPADPAGTIIPIYGRSTQGGSETSHTLRTQKQATTEHMLNSRFPSTDREVTTAGQQVLRETYHIQSMFTIKSAVTESDLSRVNGDWEGLKDRLKATLERPSTLCLRMKRTLNSLLIFGDVSNFDGPHATDNRELRYGFAFDFERTR